jgi:hypothetical protein
MSYENELIVKDSQADPSCNTVNMLMKMVIP